MREAANPAMCWHGVRYFRRAQDIPFDACDCCLTSHRDKNWNLCDPCRLGPETNVKAKP